MPDRTEQELLRRARGGDNAAFGHLQAGLERTVRRYVWCLIGQSDDEDEVVQDAFFALYMSLERITPAENLRPFLFRIVRNRCYDELRKQGRFQSVSLDGGLVGAPARISWPTDQAHRPDEQVVRRLMWAEVQEAIDRLPELQRQTMILYCDEDYSYAQIAVAMETSINTVKSRLYHARRNLRRLIGPETLEALGIQPDKGGEG